MHSPISLRKLLFVLISLLVNANALIPAARPGDVVSRAPDVTDEEPKPHCFSKHFERAIIKTAGDCENAVRKLRTLPGQENPRTFTQNKYKDASGVYTASRWLSKSCMVMVSSVKTTAVSEFRLADIATNASKILAECVTGDPQPVGGTLGIGSESSGFLVGLTGVGTFAEPVEDGHPAISQDVQSTGGDSFQEGASTSSNNETSTTISRRDDNATMTDLGLPRVHCSDKSRVAFAVIAADCEAALEILLHFRPQFQNQKWGFGPDSTIQLPFSWRYHSCMIFVGNPDESQVSHKTWAGPWISPEEAF